MFASTQQQLQLQIPRDNYGLLRQSTEVRLPNAEKAIVERDKIADYLPNAAHPDYGGKAAFFESFGFRRSEPEALIDSFQELAPNGSGAKTALLHDRKYVIIGEIQSPIW